MTLSIRFLDNYTGFVVKRVVVSESIIGEAEKTEAAKRNLKHVPAKLAKFDGCDEDEATAFLVASTTVFYAFCNSMEDNVGSKYEERTYKFPQGMKAKPNMINKKQIECD